MISEQVDTLKMIHGIPTWSKEDGEDPDMRWVQDRDGQLRCAGKAPSKEELLRLRALKPSLCLKTLAIRKTLAGRAILE